MADLIDPVELKLTTRRGAEKTYIISEMPAIQAREVAALWVPTSDPTHESYAVNFSVFMKMMKFVDVLMDNGQPLRLTTEELVNNHTDFKTMATLEKEMIKHNFGFFPHGIDLTFFDVFMAMVRPLTSEISMGSSAQSSLADAPASKS